MTGIILDSVLMLLLVCAIGYGVRLEKKLVALRAGQLAFAGAVTELNAAAGRAEAALGSLRASGEEADLLHDRLMKARQVKGELEALIARGGALSLPRSGEGRSARSDDPGGDVSRIAVAPNFPTRAEAAPRPSSIARSAASLDPTRGRESAIPAPAPDDDRALRMAALAERIQGMTPSRAAAAPVREPGRDNVSAILGALTANHAAQQSLNKARRSLDEDLFAA